MAPKIHRLRKQELARDGVGVRGEEEIWGRSGPAMQPNNQPTVSKH